MSALSEVKKGDVVYMGIDVTQPLYFVKGKRVGYPKRGTRVRLTGPEVPDSERYKIFTSFREWTNVGSDRVEMLQGGEIFNITEVPETLALF